MQPRSDTPRWLSRLQQTLVNIHEPSQRIAVFLEVVEAKSPSVATGMLRYLFETGWLRGLPEAAVTLDTAMEAIARGAWTHPHLQQIRDAAHKTEDDLVSALFPGPGSDAVASDITVTVPTYTANRPLTLGERKSIAAKPNRRLLTLALQDPHPAVIEKLLRNPKITETDVLAIASRRPNTGPVLRCVALDRKWRRRPRVVSALIYNPFTPALHAVTLMHRLSRKAVYELSFDPQANAEIRCFAAALCALQMSSE